MVRRISLLRYVIAVVLGLAATPAQAQTFTWNGASGIDADWSTATNWVGGTSPATAGTELVLFNLSSTANLNTTIGTAYSIATIQIGDVGGNPNGNVSVSGAGVLTLNNALGIDMSLATVNLSISNVGLVVAVAQSWNVAAAQTLTVTAPVTLTGQLTLNSVGTGTVNLASANTGAGGVILNAGTLIVGNATALGSGTLTISGASTIQSNATIVTTNAVLANADFAIGGTSALSLGATTLDANRIITNNNTTTTTTFASIAGTATNLTFSGNGNTTVTGVLGTPSGTLTKNGSGTLTLNGANTYTGLNTVTGGILAVNTDLSFGAVPGAAGTNILVNGGTLQQNTNFNISINRQIEIGLSGATFNNNTASGNFNIQGIVKDATGGGGALNITALSTANLYVPAGLNTYTGGTHLIGGTTVVNSNSTGSASTANLTNGPFGTGILFFDGGAQRVSTGAAMTIGNAIQITADSVFIAVATTNSLTFNGPVTITGATRTLTNQSSTAQSPIIFSGAIGDAGSNLGLSLAGTGIFQLSGASNYTGTTTVGGTSTLNLTGSLAGSSVNVNGGTLTQSTTGAISGATSTFTVTSGTATLAGTNTYGGITTVTAGTLNVARQLALYNNTPASWTDTNIVVQSGARINFNYGGAGEFTSANIDLLAALGTATGGFQSGSSFGLDTTAGSTSYTTVIANTFANANVIGFAKLGANSLTVNPANTYTGPTTISAGTLIASVLANGGTASSIGASPAAQANLVISGGTLQYTGATASTDRGFTTGTATATLDLTLRDTVLTLSGVSANATGTLTKIGAGSLTLSGTGNQLRTLNLNSFTTLDIGSGTLTIVNNAGGAGIQSSTGGIINATGGGTITIQQNNATDGANNGTANGTTLTINARITGANNYESFFAASNTGNTFLANNANDFTGNVFINSGILSASTFGTTGSPSGLGTGGGISIANALTTLRYVGTGETTNKVITLSGTITGGIIEQAGTGLLRFSSALTATGVGSKSLTLTGSTAGTGEFAAAIVNNPTVGSTLLTATFAAAATTITLNSVDGISVGAAITGAGLAGGTTITAINTATRVVTLSTAATGAGTAGASYTVTGVTNVTSVNKTGSGTWTLSGTNTYTGLTSVSQGTLVLDKSTGTIAATSPLTLSGPGTFSYLAPTGSITQNLAALTFSAGDGTVQSTFGTATASNLTFGALTRTAGATGNFVYTGGVIGTDHFINSTGALGFINQGTFVNGANYAFRNALNTFARAPVYGTDATFVTSTGGLTLGAAGASHVNLTTAAVTAQTTISYATLRLPSTFGVAITAANTLTLSSGGILKTGGNSATINGNATGIITSGTSEWVIRTDAAADTLVLNNVIIAGTGGLTKSGAGTLSITTATAQTFTGAVFINGGTYAFTGQAADPTFGFGAGVKNVTITNNATLRPVAQFNPAATTKSIVIGTGGATFDVTTIANSVQLDDAGQFSGTGDLTIIGTTGSALLNNQAFTFSGNVFVNSATLIVGANAGVLGATTGRTITVASGATLDARIATLPLNLVLNGTGIGGNGALVDNATAAAGFSGSVLLNTATTIGGSFGITLSGNVTGAALTKAGANTLVLSGVNSYTGGTTINAGTVTFAAPNAMPATGNVSTAANSSANYVGFNSAQIQAALTATPTSSAGTFAISSLNAAENYNFSTYPNLFLGATDTFTYTGTLTEPAGTTTRLGGGGGILTWTYNITKPTLLIGGGGGGTVVLTGTNTNTSTTVTNGATNGTTLTPSILSIGSDSNIGGSTTPITFGTGGVGLQVTGTALINITNHPTTITTGNFTADIVAAGNTFTLDKNLILGAASFTKNGAGTLVLTGTNNWTTGTTINGGTLRQTAYFSLPNNIPLVLSGTGSLDLNGLNRTVSDITASATTNLITDNASSPAGTSTLTVSASPAANATIAALITDGATRAVAVQISNGNANNPAFTLTNANTFSGGLTLLNQATGTRLLINANPTTVGTPGAITSSPFGRGTITIGQANSDRAGIYLSTATITIVNAITFNTGLGTDRFGIRLDAAGNVLSGLITANLASATFTSNSTGSATLTGQVTGPSGLIIDSSQNAAAAQNTTITLNNGTVNANNYQGDTVINRNAAALKVSNLVLGANNQIPNGLGFGNVIITTVGTGIGSLDLNGKTETINGLSGTGTVTSGIAGTVTFTLGDGNATQSFSGVIQNGTGTVSLTKIGTGTQALTGVNTYTGATTVSAGQLAVTGTGTLASGTGLSVASGAVFTFTPTTPATLTEAVVTLAGGSTINLSTLGAAASRITSTGVATTSGNVNIGLSGASLTTGPYTILSAASGLSGATYTIMNPTNFTFTTTPSDTSIILNATSATALTSAFWLGGLGSNPTVWAASNGLVAGNSNWTTDGAGTATPLVPGATAVVTFSDASAGAGNQLGMTLGSNMAVASLNFNNSTNPISTLNDGNTLAITTAAGITMALGSNTVSLGNNFILGLAQTWTNNSTTNSLDVSGRIDTNGLVLTLTGPATSNINISGVITGSGGITKQAAGTATLSAANAYTGATTIGDATAAVTSTLTFSADQGILGALNIGLIAAPLATTGTGNLNVGTATFTTGSVTTFSTTANVITIAAGKTLTFTNGLSVGINENTVLSSKPTRLTVTGGNLVITGGNAQFGVSQGTINAANNSAATVDLTGLSNFSFAGASFNVGQGNTSSGVVSLANTASATNTIIATLVTVGDSGANNAAGANSLTLGSGTSLNPVTNVLQSDTFTIASGKSNATLSFASQTAGSPGSVVITNKAGTGAAVINVGSTGTSTGGNVLGTLDLRGHTATVTASTLTLGNQTAVGSGGSANGIVSFDAGTFNVTTLNIGLRSGAITAANSNILNALNIGGGTFTVGGTTTLSSSTATGAFVSTVTSNINLTAGVLSLGTLNLASKTGAANTGVITGNINVSGGSLTIRENSTFTLATQSNAGTAIGLLNITGGTVTTNADILDGGGATTTTITVNGGTLDMLNRNIGSATVSIDNVNLQSGTFQNVAQVNNGSGIAKTTAGTLILTGTNTYTGGTTVANTGGILSLQSSTGLGAGTVTVAHAGLNTGTFDLTLTGTNSFSNNFNFTASANSLDGGGTASVRNTSGSNTLSGTMTLTGTGGNGINFESNGGLLTLSNTISSTVADSSRLINFGGTGNGLVSGAIIDGGVNLLSVRKTGTGTWTLSGPNTYGKVTEVFGGTLVAGVASVPGVSGAFGLNSAVTLANVAGVTLDITGFNTQIGSLTGGGALGGNVTLGSQTLTVGGDNTSPAAYAGVISGTGGSIAKIGTGTQILSGTNGYTGATGVSAGELRIATGGSLATGSAVSVTGTGTLSGTGTVGGATTVSTGGTIRGDSGTGTGTLSTGSVTVNAGGSILAAVGDPTLSPTFGLSSNLSLNASSGTLNLITNSKLSLIAAPAFNGATSSTYLIASVGTGLGSTNLQLNGAGVADLTTFGTFVQGTGATGAVVIDTTGFSLLAGDTFTLSRSGDNLILSYAPVPEPGTILGIAAAGLGLAGWVRRRRVQHAI